MKICVTSEGKDLKSKIDPRFGRCQYFIIVDTETSDFEAIENPNINSTGGAGIQSAQIVASKNIKALVTGNVGPNAFQTLQAAGVGIFTGASGSVKEAIDKFKKGGFEEVKGPSVSSKFGMPGRN